MRKQNEVLRQRLRESLDREVEYQAKLTLLEAAVGEAVEAAVIEYHIEEVGQFRSASLEAEYIDTLAALLPTPAEDDREMNNEMDTHEGIPVENSCKLRAKI